MMAGPSDGAGAGVTPGAGEMLLRGGWGEAEGRPLPRESRGRRTACEEGAAADSPVPGKEAFTTRWRESKPEPSRESR